MNPFVDRRGSRGIVSLWDMLKFNAAAFYNAASRMQDARHYVQGEAKDEGSNWHKRDMQKEHRELTMTHVGELYEALQLLGTTVTALAVKRLLKELGDFTEEFSYQDFSVSATDIEKRMRDELSLTNLFVLSAEKAKCYNPPELIFGKGIADKFPGLVEDIAESGNCFALGRFTACVFHLMRAMEASLQQWAAKLGVTLTDQKVWQTLLDQINAPIKAMSPKDPSTALHAAIASHLYNVKLAWRNEVMHPKGTYSEEEADSILRAVRAFLAELTKVI